MQPGFKQERIVRDPGFFSWSPQGWMLASHGEVTQIESKH